MRTMNVLKRASCASEAGSEHVLTTAWIKRRARQSSMRQQFEDILQHACGSWPLRRAERTKLITAVAR